MTRGAMRRGPPWPAPSPEGRRSPRACPCRPSHRKVRASASQRYRAAAPPPNIGIRGANGRWAESARVSARCSAAPMSARPLRTQRCRAASLPGGAGGRGPGQIADLGLVVEVGDLHPQKLPADICWCWRSGADGGLDQLPPHENQRHPAGRTAVEDQRAEGGRRWRPGDACRVSVDVVPWRCSRAPAAPRQHRTAWETCGTPADTISVARASWCAGRHRRSAPTGRVAVVALLGEALQAGALPCWLSGATRGDRRGRLAIRGPSSLWSGRAALGEIASGGVQVQRAVGVYGKAVLDIARARAISARCSGPGARRNGAGQPVRTQRRGREPGRSARMTNDERAKSTFMGTRLYSVPLYPGRRPAAPAYSTKIPAGGLRHTRNSGGEWDKMRPMAPKARRKSHLRRALQAG